MRPNSATNVTSEENLQLPGQTTPDDTAEPSRTGTESRTPSHDPDVNSALSDTVSQAGSNKESHVKVLCVE